MPAKGSKGVGMAIVLRPGLKLGEAAAEDDQRFLSECFENTVAYRRLADIEAPECIALGRTGAGKSATLIHLSESEQHVSIINPEDLSLNYITNSNIIRFFDDIGVDLSVFYQLLWRHILVVELLKIRKQFHDENSANRWFARIQEKLAPNPKRKLALEYLKEFGDCFWLDTEKRVRQVVDTIESSLTGQLGMTFEALKQKFSTSAGGGQKKSREEVTEIIHKAQKVVNEVQIQKLNEVIYFLSEDIFDDSRNSYFLVIDDLDTGWVHDRLRFKLIRGLIETVKKFRRVRNLKIVISLRTDLLQTVLENTQAAGFQAEKFDNLMLRIRWDRSSLKSMIEQRINFLFKDQYTKRDLQFEDIFSGKIGDASLLDYMLDRSFQRPRDLISFTNECLALLDSSQTAVTAKIVRSAEATYSQKRFRALADEWREGFGDLEIPISALAKLDTRFQFSDLDERFFEDLCLNLVAGDISGEGRLVSACQTASVSTGNYSAVRRIFIQTMYTLGVVGVKRNSGSKFEWSYKDDPSLNESIFLPDTKLAIHPILHRHFNKKSDGSTFNTQ